MSKSKDSVIRFAVRNKTGLISNIWRCWVTNRNDEVDIYIGIRKIAGTLKISLHNSGSWQVGFTTEYMNEKLASGFKMPNSRHFHIWNNPKMISDGVIRAMTIYIPTSSVCSPNNSNKQITYVDVTSNIKTTIITFLIIKKETHIELNKNENIVLGLIKLKNNEELLIFSSFGETPKIMPLKNTNSLNILTDNIPETLAETSKLRCFIPLIINGEMAILDTLLQTKTDSFLKKLKTLKEQRLKNRK